MSAGISHVWLHQLWELVLAEFPIPMGFQRNRKRMNPRLARPDSPLVMQAID
jgi:hypothetical protein